MRLPSRSCFSRGRAVDQWGARALALLLTWLAAGCATQVPADYERRVAEARRGLDGDLAIEARREEVEAAIARERGEAVLDAIQIRVRNEYEEDYRLRLTGRIPVPDPTEVRAQRELRRADTEASLARLEETALSRRADSCFLSIESEAHRERAEIYKEYASWQRVLLEWNEEWRLSGSQSDRTATRFELETRIRLATRRPGPAPEARVSGPGLPPVAPVSGRLVVEPTRVRQKILHHNPSVAVYEAISERYRALSSRADGRRRPRIDFVDLSYEPVDLRDDNEFAAQVAVRVPLGASAREEVNRYRALGRGQEREGETLVEEHLRRSLFALRQLDHFETSAQQWGDLLTLAERATRLAQQGWRERLAKPSSIAALFEQAYDAYSAVLEARERAGMASCTLLALTGVSVEDWPRE